jgi:hypothetical protein
VSIHDCTDQTPDATSRAAEQEKIMPRDCTTDHY